MSSENPSGVRQAYNAASYVLVGAQGGDLKTASPLSIAPPTPARVHQNEQTNQRTQLSKDVAGPRLTEIKNNNENERFAQHDPVHSDAVPLRPAAKANSVAIRSLIPPQENKPQLKPKETYLKQKAPMQEQAVGQGASPAARPAVPPRNPNLQLNSRQTDLKQKAPMQEQAAAQGAAPAAHPPASAPPPVPERNPDLKLKHKVPMREAISNQGPGPAAQTQIQRPLLEPIASHQAPSNAESHEAAAKIKGQILSGIKRPSNYKAMVKEMSLAMVANNQKDYAAIKVTDIKSGMVKGHDKINQEDTPVNRIRNRQNAMLHIGAELILDPSLSKIERTKMIEFFIDCADEAFKRGDIDGARAFLAPVLYRPVDRLMDGDNPLIVIEEKHQKKFNALKQTGGDLGYTHEQRHAYQKKTKDFPVPAGKIQNLEAQLDGLAHTEERKKELLQDLLKVNQAKMKKISTPPKSTTTLQAALNSHYDEAHNERLDQMSLGIKPRPTTT